MIPEYLTGTIHCHAVMCLSIHKQHISGIGEVIWTQLLVDGHYETNCAF
jgi:hypothetical protein